MAARTCRTSIGQQRKTVAFQVTISVSAIALLAAIAPAGDLFPGSEWETRTPAQVGLDAAPLEVMSKFLGGQGCVVRHGYMAYTWGDPTIPQDVASACKPVIGYFLFHAVESGRLPGLDEPAANWEPCLGTLNADLGFKDRAITFRHMATQTSCYGVTEKPGTAFDYNDWQMALFWDTLFLKVYRASYDTVDEQVLHPLLTDVLQCQDRPTFLAFGPDRAGRLRISARDFARFGLLYLHEGRWRNRQLISRNHAAMAVRSPLPNSIPRTAAQKSEMCPDQRTIGSQRIPDNQTDHEGSYSYMWWINGVDRHGQRRWPDVPVDAFGAFGHANGQRAVVVIPSLDLIVSWNDTTLEEKGGNPQNEALRSLVAAVTDGTLIVNAAHPAWLKREGGRPLFMCGPGDPEDFLYRGQRRADDTRHGDQMALIEKLSGTGANCIYLIAVRSHGGDGDATHNPFVDGDPAQGLNGRILDQWEEWFTAMDRNGIVPFFILYDDSASPFGRELPAGGELKPEESQFIDALVARFKHHHHLVWCVAEEYAEGLNRAHAIKIAARIKQRDDRRHAVAIHQNHGTGFDFAGQAEFDQFAMQWNVDTASQLHAGTVTAWKSLAGRVGINLAEFADPTLGHAPSAGTGPALRRKLWAIALGGSYAMVLGIDIASTPPSDLEDCGRLVRFMESTPFDQMAPHDELARGHTLYVLADFGRSYIAYGESGESLSLVVEAGCYRLRWFNPVNGEWSDDEVRTLPQGESVFTKPGFLQADAALILESNRQTDEKQPTTRPNRW